MSIFFKAPQVISVYSPGTAALTHPTLNVVLAKYSKAGWVMSVVDM